MADGNAWGPDDQIGEDSGARKDLRPQPGDRGWSPAVAALPVTVSAKSMYCTAGNTRRLLREAKGIADGAGAFLERVEMTMHVGTHIDALGHFAAEDRMYNGNSADACLRRLGPYEARHGAVSSNRDQGRRD